MEAVVATTLRAISEPGHLVLERCCADRAMLSPQLLIPQHPSIFPTSPLLFYPNNAYLYPMVKLTPTEIRSHLKRLPGWSLKRGKLHREFKFKDFVEAFAFMTKAAMISEKLDHHPEWFNVYNRLVINLTTHDCNGISARDFAWALAVNKFSKGM